MQNCERRESSSSTRHRLFVKADHLARIQQAAWIILLFGAQLNVVGAKAACVLKVVDMRIGNEHTNRTAKCDHVVQLLLCGEANDRNSARNNHSFSVLHELDVEKNLTAISLAQQAELFSAVFWRKAALQVGVRRVGFHCPQRGVVPGIVTEQRLCARSIEDAAERDLTAGCPRRFAKFFNLRACDHQQYQRLSFADYLLYRREERWNRPFEHSCQALRP